MRSAIRPALILALLGAGLPVLAHAATVPVEGVFLLPPGQSAVKSGDTVGLYVKSLTNQDLSVTADLSSLDTPTKTVSTASGPYYATLGGISYPNIYSYDFGGFSVPATVTDGVKTIPITATDPYGNTASTTASIVVDNAPPTGQISNITFSVSPPADGDIMYLSGNVDGTGSGAAVTSVVATLLNSQGDPEESPVTRGGVVGYDAQSINAALDASADGIFHNAPIRLAEFGDTGWIARSAYMRVEIKVQDRANNITSTSLTVPIPKTSGASNVLFLPGIEGSRLYEGVDCGKSSEEKLWEPIADSLLQIVRGAGDDKVKELYLDQDGKSECADIYTKTNDIIDSVRGNGIYESFIQEMNGLKNDGTINDWRAVSYDWRLSLPDLLANGREQDGKIYYEQATSTPYIEQTLRALAATSKSGKVTLVTHSNGGLVAKALLDKLGSSASQLVDRVIMVAAPQSGAPIAVGALLFGQDQGISAYAVPILHNDVAQGLALNSPMAYHLLPSEDYLESVASDMNHRVATFSGAAYAKEISSYGSSIGNIAALDGFLLASTTLNSSLITYANQQHATLDSWVPPSGVEVDQIAGWGNDTVAGIDFYTPPPVSAAAALNPIRAYRPIFTEDGDGTVPVPSALQIASSTDVKRYWANLFLYNNDFNKNQTHKDIFEVTPLEDLIKRLLQNDTNTLPSYISTTQPASIVGNKKLTFFLHSPLTLQLQDSFGNVTGLATDNSVTENIPDSSYGEFGEVKYVTVPQGGSYHLSLRGLANGTFSLDVQESLSGAVTATSSIVGVPTTASTSASMNIESSSTLSPLIVDENGDGRTDFTITPKRGAVVAFDTTPPELKVVFSTSTKSIAFIGSDESGPVSVTSATTYPTLKKGQKALAGIATTTVIAQDAGGNTTKLIYTETLPSPAQRDTIVPIALVYNNATTTLSMSAVSYKWRLNKDESYSLFATNLKISASTLESHWRPKKNKTVVMTKPQDLDDSDTDDPVDVRPTKLTLAGMVVPFITTQKGSLIIGY